MVREIKCIAAGDDRCEFVILDIPSEFVDNVVPKVEEVVPGFYSQLDYNFSREIRERVL